MSLLVPRQKYLNPFRPHFEKTASLAWFGCAAAMVAEMLIPGTPRPLLFVLAVLCLGAGVPWISQWMALLAIRDRMDHREVTRLTISEASKEFDPSGQRILIGYGFNWSVEEAQLAREVALSDPSKLTKAESAEAPGQSWMHGICPSEEKIYLPVADEHTLIIAMTRWGKTVLFRLLITQAIARGEAVFIFDPKGDKDLLEACRQACRDMGKVLQEFHPGFPATSVRLDPLKNFTDPTEVASRITSQIGKGGRDDSFTAFCHMNLVAVVNGMMLVGERPTLVAIKRYLDGQLEVLLAKAIRAYSGRVLAPGWERSLDGYRRAAMGRRNKQKGGEQSEGTLLLSPAEEAAALTAFYREQVCEVSGSPEIEGLITAVEHPAEHRSKMLVSLMPVLTMLTSGAMAKLMSTDQTDPGDARVITDTARIIEQRGVLYVGLNALQNEKLANSIGEIMMADAASVAGQRYNYAENKKVASFFLDEADALLNAEVIRMLNKAGGAGYHLTLAAQTLSDIVARLGDRAMAEKVLGNIANLIFGRVTAAESQEYFAKRLPRVPIKMMSHSRTVSSPTVDPLSYTTSQGETLQTTMEPPIEPPTLGCLPKLQFFGLLGSRFVKGRIPVIVPDKAA